MATHAIPTRHARSVPVGRAALGLALALSLGACMASGGSGAIISTPSPDASTASGSGTLPSGTGRIAGHVSIQPCTGGPARIASPCPAGRLIRTLRIAVRPVGGGPPAAVSSPAGDGSYSVAVPAGEYEVSIAGHVLNGDRSPGRITVAAGSTVTLDLVVDSRLR